MLNTGIDNLMVIGTNPAEMTLGLGEKFAFSDKVLKDSLLASKDPIVSMAIKKQDKNALKPALQNT